MAHENARPSREAHSLDDWRPNAGWLWERGRWASSCLADVPQAMLGPAAQLVIHLSAADGLAEGVSQFRLVTDSSAVPGESGTHQPFLITEVSASDVGRNG